MIFCLFKKKNLSSSTCWHFLDLRAVNDLQFMALTIFTALHQLLDAGWAPVASTPSYRCQDPCVESYALIIICFYLSLVVSLAQINSLLELQSFSWLFVSLLIKAGESQTFPEEHRQPQCGRGETSLGGKSSDHIFVTVIFLTFTLCLAVVKENFHFRCI